MNVKKNSFDKMINRIFVHCILFTIVFLYSSNCKNALQEEEIPLKEKDSLCYFLHFRANDTIIYNIIAYDSIIIDFGEPLKKIRKEKVRVVCDSVNQNGHFFLNISHTYLESIEFDQSGNEVIRKESNWLNRKIFLEIDSFGNRFSYSIERPQIAGITAGGAFQPYLFFPFKESCKHIEESWIAQSTDELIENGLPVPLLRHSTLYRAKGYLDTLGYNCKRLEFIRTGQGSVKIITENDSFKVTNIINSYGTLDISTDYNIPVYFFSNIEQKLTIHISDDFKKPGQHFIHIEYLIEKFIPGKEKKLIDPKKSKPKRKKR